MHGKGITTETAGQQSNVLDHAPEFVELVYREAPGEYRRLLDREWIRQELARGASFNHGKLYAYAEFTVFRREFLQRFPGASPAACVNAFSGLLLKNDISIHNLLEFMEGADDREQLRLNSPA